MPSPNFFQKLIEVCGRLNIKPADLLLVMFLESGVDSSKKNQAGSGAVGLIQFMPATLKSMGLDEDTIRNFDRISPEKQLDYVEKYIRGAMNRIGKPFTSATQYYHANIFPLTLSRWSGDDPRQNKNVVVFSGKSKDRRERAAYKYNGKYFDVDGKGYVSVGDLSNKLQILKKTQEFRNIISQMINSTQYNPTKSKSYPEQGTDKMVNKIDTLIQNFMGQFKAAQNSYLISVNSTGDLPCTLEFSRILCLALKENLDAKTNIYNENNDTEISCQIKLDKKSGFDKIKKIADIVIKDFENATQKLGVKYFTTCMADCESLLPEIDIKTAEINFRKFHFKFIKE